MSETMTPGERFQRAYGSAKARRRDARGIVQDWTGKTGLMLERNDRERLVSMIADAINAESERCAGIAMGSTGPGNTIEQCTGYSAACRDIAHTIRFGAPR